MLSFSKYNIFSKIRDSENYFILNLLSGNADILDPSEAGKIKALQDLHYFPENTFIEELCKKGYIIEDSEEAVLFRNKYLDFIDSREQEEIQLFFVTNYSCNFACHYCYQDQYENPAIELTRELIDSFLNYIRTEFRDRKKYITIFGGEPLLGSPKQKNLIGYILTRAGQANLEVSFVTNGFTLEEYISLFINNKIREIQVTLDGTEDMHNKRRFLKNGAGTFNQIVRGIDSCLENSIHVNLRMVIDKENIDHLPDLAQFAIDRGWTESPFFKTQVGRNYELHHCQSSADKLFTRIGLYEKIHELCTEHPHILRFYKPAYSITRFLHDNGKLPDPLFDSCPACKTEWAFDYTGKIYPCTATVGKSDESIGTFYPATALNSDFVYEWESRDVTSINDCKDCNLQLACGGGCGSLARNRTGNICSADCRPVQELMELGFAAYYHEGSMIK